MPAFPRIFFAHGAGFPAKSYSKMLRQLQVGGFEVGYLDRIGHNPKYPVTDGWPYLVDELIDTIEERYQGEKVVGLGHSLGGFLSFMGAVKRPDLFSALVMLDSPIMGPQRAEAFGLMKRLRIDRIFTPRAPRHREWKSLDEVKRHFQTRLKRIDPECLEDFVKYGTQTYDSHTPDGQLRGLAFRPKVESEIYHCTPHNFFTCEGKLKVPTAFLGGNKSKELKFMGGPSYMEERFGIVVREMPGSHLFPLEHPAETAEAVLDIIKFLGVKSSLDIQREKEEEAQIAQESPKLASVQN